MAIKKSDLYSSLWASCDALRGGMDASQYKDYVLFMLFIKYVSDKYANSDDFAPAVVIPQGASFKDMIDLKGKSDIGDKINTQIIQPLIDANSKLARSDFPDFNDPNKLGEGKEMVERLGNLIAIFQKPELDFSQNRADHDDILGDAYEFLMRHFAQDSGKSKGQFYTPSEVSRILAKVLGVGPDNTTAKTTAYDPTCGSGSLLLKVAAEAGKQITLEGQEKDVTTAGLARMNMILHDFPTANVLSGNTLTAPKFKDGEQLRTYDYVVATRLSWIRQQQATLGAQARETPRQYVERESHYLWGRRHLLNVVEGEGKAFVTLDHKRITLHVRPGSDAAKRAELLHEWHKRLLHDVVPGLIAKWQPRLGVQVSGYFLQRMKTQWGSCNHAAGNIRLNTELVKKPKDLLEYVVVHEMAHLLEPTHSERFAALLDLHYPTWKEARAELNALPLASLGKMKG